MDIRTHFRPTTAVLPVAGAGQPNLRFTRWLMLGIALVIATITAWTVFGGTPYFGAEEQNVRAVVAVVDQFMAAGAQGDIAVSRILVSTARSLLTEAELTNLLQTRRDLFDGYLSVSEETYGMTLDTNWNGTFALFEGKVSYTGRPNTPLRAELIKRNNQWRLMTISFGTTSSQ